MYVMGYRALEYNMCVYTDTYIIWFYNYNVYLYIYIYNYIYNILYIYKMGCRTENTTEDQVEYQVPKKWECHWCHQQNWKLNQHTFRGTQLLQASPPSVQKTHMKMRVIMTRSYTKSLATCHAFPDFPGPKRSMLQQGTEEQAVSTM